jgi:uncharacterized protein (DUF1330 family)
MRFENRAACRDHRRGGKARDKMGAFASRQEHAMPAYIIAEIQVTDPTAYEGYRPLAAASVARYGGRFLVRGGKIDLLEGGPEPERIVVIEFPEADAARRWYGSDEYQKALKIRQSASRGRVFLVEGA